MALVVFFVEVVAIQSSAHAEAGADAAIRFALDLPIFAYIVLAVTSAALVLRRRYPLVVLATNLMASLLWAALNYASDPLLATLISLYSVGRYVAETSKSFTAVGASLVLVSLGNTDESAPLAAIGFSLILAFVPWYVGRRMRIRREFLAVLEERAAYQERERLAERRNAVAEERARIARELHDVVAHRVSMMTVQAGAAKTVAADDPDGAYRAMEAVEQAGRQALGELRHLLGVLRPGPPSEHLAPNLGLADVPRLVDQLGDTGLEISLATDGIPVDVPARVDLSAYRIVQEALTNVLKHAGPKAKAEVRLGSDNGMLVVEVSDRGVGATILPGSGHGIAGMRERALLLGGTLEAGRRAGGGFFVLARLPIGEEQS